MTSNDDDDRRDDGGAEETQTSGHFLLMNNLKMKNKRRDDDDDDDEDDDDGTLRPRKRTTTKEVSSLASASATDDDAMALRIEAAMLQRAQERHRANGGTLCPSEVPRLSLKLIDWRAHMDATRAVARRLARDGVLEVLQKGRVVSPDDNIRGPIRLRLKAAS